MRDHYSDLFASTDFEDKVSFKWGRFVTLVPGSLEERSTNLGGVILDPETLHQGLHFEGIKP